MVQVSEQKNKLWYIHIASWHLAMKKNIFTPSCNGVDEPHKHYNKWKKPDIQYILYNSSYTKYKIWQNLSGLLEVRIIVTIL